MHFYAKKCILSLQSLDVLELYIIILLSISACAWNDNNILPFNKSFTFYLLALLPQQTNCNYEVEQSQTNLKAGVCKFRSFVIQMKWKLYSQWKINMPEWAEQIIYSFLVWKSRYLYVIRNPCEISKRQIKLDSDY